MIETLLTDITAQKADAIVNAANPYLTNGSGVAGAIRLAAGEMFQKECDEWVEKNGPLGVGESCVVSAHDLPAQYVIHTVGPVYGQSDGQEAQLLEMSYKTSLHLANQLGVEEISYPAISCGIFRYPLEEAASISISAVRRYQGGVKRVRFCLFDVRALEAFQKALGEE